MSVIGGASLCIYVAYAEPSDEKGDESCLKKYRKINQVLMVPLPEGS